MSEPQPPADGRHQCRDDVPRAPVFDLDQRGMLVAELGADVLIELEASFWNDCSGLMVRAAGACARRDRSELGEALHTLKGAASNLGFAAIAAAATRLRAGPFAVGDWPDLTELELQLALTREALAGKSGQAS
ncbi:MAG: Hpt domain-containing protein [Ancalomicrobiaceae bacterium]|nr:Hpt domain-containing protein [Ancalomicrobiaceae bacterium]